jgi:hypothetical protein
MDAQKEIKVDRNIAFRDFLSVLDDDVKVKVVIHVGGFNLTTTCYANDFFDAERTSDEEEIEDIMNAPVVNAKISGGMMVVTLR